MSDAHAQGRRVAERVRLPWQSIRRRVLSMSSGDAAGADIRVAIVFIDDARESLARVASLGHVWVVRAPLN
jgi:hypothetical protein